MQILGPDEGALPALPETPLLERWLYESPTLPVGLLVLLAVVVLFVTLKKPRRLPGLLIAGVLLAASAGLFLTARSVTTQREMLSARSALLVDAVASVDLAAVRTLVHPEVRVGPSDNADGIARNVPKLSGLLPLESAMALRLRGPNQFIGSHQVLETRAGMDAPNMGRTLVRVRLRGPSGELLGHSWWELEWKLSSGDWLASRIEAIWIQG